MIKKEDALKAIEQANKIRKSHNMELYPTQGDLKDIRKTAHKANRFIKTTPKKVKSPTVAPPKPLQEKTENNSERNTLIKRANQRLLELEKKGVKTEAYLQAKHYLNMTNGTKGKKPRFSRNMTDKQYNIMLQFLNNPSSSSRGLKKVLSKTSETLMKKYKMNEKELNDLYKLLKNAQYKKTLSSLPSNIAVDVTTRALKKGFKTSDILKMIEESNEITSRDGFMKKMHKALGDKKVDFDMKKID